MSPASNTNTEIANASYSTANFASVYAVLDSFKTVLMAGINEPEELDAAVRCTDSGVRLRALALVLLAAASDKNLRIGVIESHWARMCSELAAKTVFLLKGLQVPEQIAESLDVFVLQDAAVHVDVLYWFTECILMQNTAVKEIIDSESEKAKRVTTADDMDTRFVRLEPFGEISKQRYWMFGNKTKQLYQEGGSKRTRNKFELLAQTVDEFEKLAQELDAGRLRVHKELAERIREEVVPFVEKQALRKEKLERKLARNAQLLANVHVYETRTRKRGRVNYNLDADPYGVEDY